MPDLSTKKILMAVASEKYRDEELNHPREVFEQRGAKVVVASNSRNVAKGMLGATVKPDLSFSEVKVDDYDAVVVVGGQGSPAHLWDNKDLRGILQKASSKNKVVAGICLSGAVLAKAGLLKNLDATVYPTPEALEEFKKCGARYKRDPVVVAGTVVTANGPEAAKDFGKAVADTLLHSKPAPATK